MRRVITYGTFDMLHYGHINLLKRAKERGDYLIVALSTDEFNSQMKNKKTYFSIENNGKVCLRLYGLLTLLSPRKVGRKKNLILTCIRLMNLLWEMTG